MRLRQVSGGRKVALAQQHQHLHSSHIGKAIHKVLLARGLTGLSEQISGAVHIPRG